MILNLLALHFCTLIYWFNPFFVDLVVVVVHSFCGGSQRVFSLGILLGSGVRVNAARVLVAVSAR